MNSDYRKIVTDEIKSLLKPYGFTKKGNVFLLKNGDITYYVDTQSSLGSTKDSLKLTVNVRLTSEQLAWLSGTSMAEDKQDHHVQRIGQYYPGHPDKWWVIQNEREASQASNEITHLLASAVLPAIFRIRRLVKLNSTLSQWIDAVDDYSLEQLRRQPQEGSWSLGQVYTHILDDTEWFVGQMKAALATKENRDKEMHADAKQMFRNDSFPDLQIQGPATNLAIAQPQSKEEMVRRLKAIKTTVNKLFSVDELWRIGGKTRHPGLLYFSAGEWLQFAEMHMRHHLRQKARIDKILGKNVGG